MLTVLIVEDDAAISEMLGYYLRSEQFNVLQAEDGKIAQTLLASNNVDLILLDWMLPDISGPKLISKFHGNPELKAIPIIMLTALAEEEDKIKGLESGADDYMTKPVSLKELKARINALLRRSQKINDAGYIEIGPLSLDPVNHKILVAGSAADISPTEFRLLRHFMRNPGRLHSRSQLLDQVWGRDVYIDERTVDVHVLRLRKFLKVYGVDRMIVTVRGAGYRFVDSVDE